MARTFWHAPPLERRYCKKRRVSGLCDGPLLILIFINDLENELTCNHFFFADDVKLIAPRSQQHELRSSIEQALNWSRRWDLPLNASKSQYLSIGSHPDDRLVHSEEANGEQMTKCEQINDLGIAVNSAFTQSANVLTAANKARGMLYFLKRSFTCLTKEIFLPLHRALARPYLERIQRAATRWVKGFRTLFMKKGSKN